MANNATLAGHVHIEDFVTLGGATLIHQFCHIGEHAFTAYGARINKDVPPFMMVGEGKAHPRGLNVEGLKRRGFSEQRLQALKEAYRILYRSELSLELAIEQMRPLESASKDVARLREFLERAGRSIVR
jgi:UDP-N-acetylglucosamine acyltransferase